MSSAMTEPDRVIDLTDSAPAGVTTDRTAVALEEIDVLGEVLITVAATAQPRVPLRELDAALGVARA